MSATDDRKVSAFGGLVAGRGKPKRLEEIMLQCPLVYHKSHADDHETESGLPQEKSDDQPTKVWRGIACYSLYVSACSVCSLNLLTADTEYESSIGLHVVVATEWILSVPNT